MLSLQCKVSKQGNATNRITLILLTNFFFVSVATRVTRIGVAMEGTPIIWLVGSPVKKCVP
jgi:hypothetical protein